MKIKCLCINCGNNKLSIKEICKNCNYNPLTNLDSIYKSIILSNFFISEYMHSENPVNELDYYSNAIKTGQEIAFSDRDMVNAQCIYEEFDKSLTNLKILFIVIIILVYSHLKLLNCLNFSFNIYTLIIQDLD